MRHFWQGVREGWLSPRALFMQAKVCEAIGWMQMGITAENALTGRLNPVVEATGLITIVSAFGGWLVLSMFARSAQREQWRREDADAMAKRFPGVEWRDLR